MPSRLNKEAMKIAGGVKSPVFNIECHFLTPNGTQKAYDVIGSDFYNNYFDGTFASEISLDILVDINLYNGYIYPTKQSLNIVLLYRQCDRESGLNIPGGTYFTREYRGVLQEATDGNFGDGEQPRGASTDSLKRCTLQLIEHCVMNVLNLQGGGQFKLTDAYKAMATILSVGANSPAVKGSDKLRFQIAETDIPFPPDSIMVPHSTYLKKVPHYIHEHCGGVYQFGLGSFIQDKVWHIYPLYNLDANKVETGRKLTIIHVPPSEIAALDRTWTLSGNDARIVSTGKVKIQDLSVGLQLEHGSGARIIKTDQMLAEATTDNDNNQSNLDPGNFMTGFNVEKRLDGKTIAPIAPAGTTIAEAMSNLAGAKLQIATIQWSNSDIHLIRPGMPVTFFFDQSGQIRVHEGKVIGVREVTTKVQGGLTNKALQTAATLTIIITRVPTRVM